MTTVTVNGEPRDVEPGCTVRRLLENLSLADRPCAVEINRQIISKPAHERHELHDGDLVEIVTLVGGG